MNRLKELTAKERLFCKLFFLWNDPEKAAVAAGYRRENAKYVSENLLEDPRIHALLRTLEQKGGCSDPIREGLETLAFGAVNDVVKLAVYGGGLSETQLDTLDFSALSEIKAGEKGLEIKLCDRLKAIEMLEQYLQKGIERKQGGNGFLTALEQGAALIREGMNTGDEL